MHTALKGGWQSVALAQGLPTATGMPASKGLPPSKAPPVTQIPEVQFWPMPQRMHWAAAVPQAKREVPGWHMPFTQQPVGQFMTSHTGVAQTPF